MRARSLRQTLRESVSRSNLWYAALAGVTGVAGSFAAAGYTRRFLVAPIDDLVVRLTPGEIIAFMIQNVGEEAHLLHVALSVCIAIGALGATAWLGIRLAERTGRALSGGFLSGVLAWGLITIATSEPFLALGGAVPVAAFTVVGGVSVFSIENRLGRRRQFISGAGALTFLGLSVGLGRLHSAGGGSDPAAYDPADAPPEVKAMLESAEAASLPVSGDMPGLVSTFGEFYNVSISQFDPEITADDWSLTITGEVGDDVEITFDDLTAMPTEHRFTTLRCVGENLNGQKLDNAVWTGTPIKPLLEEADPGGACGCAMLRAEDGYFVQFPIEALEDGFLAWGMNGQALPESHGRPVRVLIPGHWGETNVKWLEEIELLEEEADGFWEKRGWHGTGPVNTVAKLWSSGKLQDGRFEVAGHAYAGTRGVSDVEVSIDGGGTWQSAELSEALPGDDVWRQWRYVFEPDGSHEVVVRAIEDDGTIQPRRESKSYPSGATGWVSKEIEA